MLLTPTFVGEKKNFKELQPAQARCSFTFYKVLLQFTNEMMNDLLMNDMKVGAMRFGIFLPASLTL